jgi:heme exporter protein D
VRLIAAFIVLLAADIWTALTVFNAVFNSGGHGGVFWTSVGIIAVILIVLCRFTWRVGKRLRATFASRFARPS